MINVIPSHFSPLLDLVFPTFQNGTRLQNHLLHTTALACKGGKVLQNKFSSCKYNINKRTGELECGEEEDNKQEGRERGGAGGGELPSVFPAPLSPLIRTD